MSSVEGAYESLELLTSGNLEIRAEGKVYVSGQQLHVGDDNTEDIILTSTHRIYIDFACAQPEHWDDEPPHYLWDAIDRIAAALTELGHKP